MADVQQAQTSLLTSKWGPLPVWGWSLIGLAVAWIYAKWRASQQDKANQDTATPADTGMGTDQTQAVAPQFVIENNLPSESSPVTAPATPPVQSTPPGTSSHPPVVVPPGRGTPIPAPAPTGKPAGVTATPIKAPTPVKKKPPIQYRVKPGDTLSSIAARYHTTWQKLWAFNTTPGNRPAATIATLKKRGPNLIEPNELILIPQ